MENKTLFDDIEKKIYLGAKIIFWLSVFVVVGWLIILIMVFAGESNSFKQTAIIVCFSMIFTGIGGMILSFVLYGFGRITQDIHAMKLKYCEGEEYRRPNAADGYSSFARAQENRPRSSDGVINLDKNANGGNSFDELPPL